MIYIIWLVILLIVFPLMQPGYIFSLDQVLNPNGWTTQIWSNLYWVSLLSQVFVFLHIPIWVMEKLLILMVFILPSIWWYLLLRSDKKEKAINPGILFWIFLLIFNPFLYSRFIDGQINIYLSYILYPLFFYLLKRYSRKQDWKNIIYLSILSFFLCLTSIHNAIFILFIAIIFSIFHVREIWVRHILKTWLALILINMIWFIPFAVLKNSSDSIHQMGNFWLDHREAFQTLPWDTNLYFNALALNWYWWEQEWRFKPNTDVNTKWKNVFFILFFIVLVWVLSKVNIKEKKVYLDSYEKSLLTLWFVAFVFSLWIWGGWILWNINNLMFEYFPFYTGMREPQKWVMFIIIIYAYFGCIWVNLLAQKMSTYNIHTFTKNLSIIFLVSVPIIYTPATFLWFFWQVSIQQYASEWKEIKQQLIIPEENNCKSLDEWKTTKCYDTLSFPWHGYIWVNFTKKIVLWSIVKYFWDDVLFWDNLEIWNIYTQSDRLESRIIEKYIAPGWILREKNIDIFSGWIPFIRELRGLWIQNIILLKEIDYKFYEWFLEQLVIEGILERSDENSMIVLYKIINKQWHSYK